MRLRISEGLGLGIRVSDLGVQGLGFRGLGVRFSDLGA